MGKAAVSEILKSRQFGSELLDDGRKLTFKKNVNGPCKSPLFPIPDEVLLIRIIYSVESLWVNVVKAATLPSGLAQTLLHCSNYSGYHKFGDQMADNRGQCCNINSIWSSSDLYALDLEHYQPIAGLDDPSANSNISGGGRGSWPGNCPVSKGRAGRQHHVCDYCCSNPHSPRVDHIPTFYTSTNFPENADKNISEARTKE